MKSIFTINYYTKWQSPKTELVSWVDVSKVSCINVSVKVVLFNLVTIVGVCNCDGASLVRHDIPYQTFRDFAENKGPFIAGAKNIIIKDKQGKQVERLDKAPMADFSSVDKIEGVATLISPQYAVSAKHNSSYHFDDLYFANGHYNMVGKDNSPFVDFSLIRLNKLVTETLPADLLPAGVKNEEFDTDKRFSTFYRVGTGIQRIITAHNKISTVAPGYEYLTGGVVEEPKSEDHTLRVVRDDIFSPQYSPLSSHALPGDSGSPLFAWDKTLNKWVIVAVTKGGNKVSINSFEIIPVDFVNAMQEKYNATPINNNDSKLPFFWTFNSATGTGIIQQGNEKHIMRGKKDSDLNAGNNLSFKGAGGNIILRDNVDQGAGTLNFAGNYTVVPQTTQTWVGGGVDIARSAQVTWRVPGVQGDDLHKIGEGKLIINGTGINPGGLKAGNGVVLLDQQPDSQNRAQAFSSVNIASGRATVVLGDDRQVNPDTISWGDRGGTLDVKGNSLAFRKMNVADYGAILTNSAQKRADIKFNFTVTLADTPVREWSQSERGIPGELYHYKNSNTLTHDYFILKTIKYSFFPLYQTSDGYWEFIGHNREDAIRKVYEKNKDNGYIYHGQLKGNLNIKNGTATSDTDTLILDGAIDISGKFTQENGKLFFQGHPVIHAFTSKDFVSGLNDLSVKVQPVSFSQPDWERRTFRLAELELNNTQFNLSRNATLHGKINAHNSVVRLGSPTVYIDLNDGNGTVNVPQKGSSIAGHYGDMSQYQGKVTLKNRSVLEIREKFTGSITAQDSRVTISSRNAQLYGLSKFVNTPLSIEANAKLTARGGWLSDSDITLGASSSVRLSGKKMTDKTAGTAFYTVKKGAKYLLLMNSSLHVLPFAFFSGDIFSAYSSTVYFGGANAFKPTPNLKPAEQKKIERFAGFNTIWNGDITAPRAQVNLTNTRWQMQEDARMHKLILSRSLAGFTGESKTFSILSTNYLQAENSGFVLSTDLKNSDKIVIHNQATGSNNILFVENKMSGKKPSEINELNIPLVIAPAGTSPAMFKAVKRVTGFSEITPVIRVEENTENTKWILDGFTAKPNPETSAPANNFLNMAYKTFIAEVNNLDKRMGDLRDTQGEGGIWARSFNGAGRGALGYAERYVHFQSGFDKKRRQQGANLFTGILTSYTNSHFSGQGYRGNTLSFGGGLYASAIFDSGAYVDVIGKYLHHRHDYLAAFSGLAPRKYTSHSWYGGVEVGYRYSFGRDLFIEPQAELTYGAVPGITLKWQDNDQQIAMKQKPFTPLIGRLGVTVGKTFDNQYGGITVRTGLDYQFDLNATGGTVLRDKVAEQHFASKKDGRMLYHVGLNGQVKDKLRFGLAMERSAFGRYNVDHAMNMHLRYSF